MGIKFFKIIFALILTSMLQSCPSIGEEVTYKITIPSENNYFGNTINLYQKTGVINAWYVEVPLLFLTEINFLI
jgi:hypothetical protein